jgi:cytochrome c5
VNFRFPLCLIIICSCVSALSVAAQNPPAQQKSGIAAKAATKKAPNESAEGGKRFETHCGRCHVPPEALSPREVKAVLRHMRVRANLTEEDQRLILKYLAP